MFKVLLKVVFGLLLVSLIVCWQWDHSPSFALTDEDSSNPELSLIDNSDQVIADAASSKMSFKLKKPVRPLRLKPPKSLNMRIISSVELPARCIDVDITSVKKTSKKDKAVEIHTYAFVVTHGSGFHIVNVTDPLTPFLIPRPPSDKRYNDVVVWGDRLFLAEASGVLEIYDISNPDTPKPMKVIGNLGSAKGIAVLSDEHAFVAGGLSGVHLVNVNPASNQGLLGTIPTNESAEAIVLDKKLAYVACGKRGLLILDIDPLNATYIVGELNIDGFAQDVWKSGALAYLADPKTGIHVINVKDNDNPHFIKTIKLPGATNLGASSEYLFCSAGKNGLFAFDSRTHNPLDSINTNGIARGMSVHEPFIYLANNAHNLKIIEIKGTGFLPPQPAPSYQGPCASWGGADVDKVDDIAIDQQGNIYITGSFTGTSDFKPGPESYELTAIPDGGSDVFVSKFDDNRGWLWTIHFPGLGIWDEGHGVSVDSSGNVYVIGTFSDEIDMGVDAGGNNIILYSNGGKDIFWAKYEPDSDLIEAFSIGGLDNDEGLAIKVSIDDQIYITGSFEHDVYFNGFGDPLSKRTSNGANDVFLVKYDDNNVFQWVDTWGDSFVDKGTSIDTFGESEISVTGQWNNRIFLRTYDPSKIVLREHKWPSERESIANDIIYDDSGNIYITGTYEGRVNFNPYGSPPDYHESFDETPDIFLISLSRSGYNWTNTWGNVGIWDEGHGLSIGLNGVIIVTGHFSEEVDFDTGSGENWLKALGENDSFLCAFDSDSTYKWAYRWGGLGIWDEGHGLSVRFDGPNTVIYVTGMFTDVVDFDPTGGFDYHQSVSELEDTYLVEYMMFQ